MIVSISYARTHLCRRIGEVVKGKEVIITRRGVPVAEFVAITKEPQKLKIKK